MDLSIIESASVQVGGGFEKPCLIYFGQAILLIALRLSLPNSNYNDDHSGCHQFCGSFGTGGQYDSFQITYFDRLFHFASPYGFAPTRNSVYSSYILAAILIDGNIVFYQCD
jgi:hypothetical protein